MSENFLVRNVFNETLILEMANAFSKASNIFKKEVFLKTALNFTEETSYKNRASVITTALIASLPSNYNTASKIILNSFKFTTTKSNWESFYFLPIGNYVAIKGCKRKYLPISFKLIYEITKRFTSEFAIRPFLDEYFEETLIQLGKWNKDPNEHVRRLVSEGTRQRLPWGKSVDNLNKHPEKIIALLEPLKDDPSKYVQKSVANHLNDLSKSKPDLFYKTLFNWREVESESTRWIIKHALRNELKKGNSNALKLLGYDLNPKIKVINFKLDAQKIQLGETLGFQFEIQSDAAKSQTLQIDYIIHYLKSNGKTAPKTFKIKSITISLKEKVKISKKQTFKPFTTRKHYSGIHYIEVFINGLSFNKQSFHLVL